MYLYQRVTELTWVMLQVQAQVQVLCPHKTIGPKKMQEEQNTKDIMLEMKA